MLQIRFLPEKTAESILDSMKQGFRFIRRQGAMEALIVLAFAMTALGIPMRTFLPVFAKEIFHSGPETYAMFLSVTGMGSIVGALAVAGLGNVRHKGRIALSMLILLGVGSHRGVSPLSRSLAVSYVRLLFLLGRVHDGGIRLGEFAGAVDHHQRNARPRDERLQFRLSRRHADGKPGGRLARPNLYGSRGAGRQWVLLLALARLYFLLVQRRVAAL